jgi:eukaryotic-like serine/threonine-protein kinase
MRKKSPFIIEIVLGLFLSVFLAWAYAVKLPFFEKVVSLPIYDIFSKFRVVNTDTAAIHIVEIDEPSTLNLGRWPWPRALQSELIDQVAYLGAKIIGMNVGYFDADHNEAIDKIMELNESYADLLNSHKAMFRRARINSVPFQEFAEKLNNARFDMDNDAILAQVIEDASNVVLPMYFAPGIPVENLAPMAADFIPEKLVGAAAQPGFPLLSQTKAAVLPLKVFIDGSLAIGHSNLEPDVDDKARRMFPIMRYGTNYYPSFAVQILRQYRNMSTETVSWRPGSGFNLGDIVIPVDETGGAFIQFAGPTGTFKRHSALDVLTGSLPDSIFENKIVLIGLTTTGGGENFPVPIGGRMTGLEIWANHIQNMLSQNTIARPPWAQQAEWGGLIAAMFLVIFALPLLKARMAVPLAAAVFVGLIGTCGFLFVKQGLWVSPAYGAFLLLAGFLVLVAKRLMFTERSKEMVEAEGVETNKMLGLSFQGQGMLDLAFEKFRKCPVDHSMKELLYNLGLDMERKRQFTKAAAVYEHIAANDPKYKDIKEKIELLKKAGDGVIFGPVGKKGADSTVVVDGLGHNTTLGRYEIIRELGRGAMGIVYLGKDPKINRQVAVKTLRFEDETDDEQIKSTKERFFREAESAGNLTHPNIIRIFDAGEDQDVAYIAMELLEGGDLKKYCEKSNLLPLETALEYVAKIADALDFAHQQGVVHRDIKPGNIMLLKDNTLRITDFGIARIQATSKTATGAVLGTPAYMSPEQVNGKKVDGRADIFSLGVTLYELLTGEKPFQADSIAALLFRIANVDAPNPREHKSEIPDAIIPILNKALAKSPDERYQTGADMAQDLRDFLKKVKSGDNTPQMSPGLLPLPTQVMPEAPKPLEIIFSANRPISSNS